MVVFGALLGSWCQCAEGDNWPELGAFLLWLDSSLSARRDVAAHQASHGLRVPWHSFDVADIHASADVGVVAPQAIICWNSVLSVLA